MAFRRTYSPFTLELNGVPRTVCCPSLNQILFEYESQHIRAPQYASASVKIIDAQNIEDRGYLWINGFHIRISDTPGAGEIPSFASGANVSQMMAAIYFAINDLPISRDYSFQLDTDNVLRIYATRPGQLYNLNLVPSGNNMFDLTESDAQPANFAEQYTTKRTAYKIFMYLFMEQDGPVVKNFSSLDLPDTGWVKIAEFKQEYGATGATFSVPDFDGEIRNADNRNRFRFDLAGAIRPFLTPKPPRFAADTGFPVFEANDGILRRFAFTVGEEYVDFVDELGNERMRKVEGFTESMGKNQAEYPSIYFWAARSGFGEQLSADRAYRLFMQYWRRKFTNNISVYQVYPLHFHPARKYSSIQAVEYLFFLYQRGENKTYLDVKFDFLFEDGTQLNEQFFSRFKTKIKTLCEEGRPLLSEVSLRTIDWQLIESTQGAKILDYTVTVVEYSNDYSDGEDVTKPVTFTLENDSRSIDDASTLMWLNRLGGYDTWFSTGVTEKRYDAERVSNDKAVRYESLNGYRNYNENTYTDYKELSNKNTYYTKSKVKYAVSTGWMDRGNFDFLRHIAKSEQVYLIRREDADLTAAGRVEPRACEVESFEWVERFENQVTQFNIKIELSLNYDC